jgi:hypothetical protein
MQQRLQGLVPCANIPSYGMAEFASRHSRYACCDCVSVLLVLSLAFASTGHSNRLDVACQIRGCLLFTVLKLEWWDVFGKPQRS